jgi:hypothetical protein
MKPIGFDMHKYPVITDSFNLREGTFRFVRYKPITYWHSIDQQGVEQLIKNKWVKLSYEESSRIAKLYLNGQYRNR